MSVLLCIGDGMTRTPSLFRGVRSSPEDGDSVLVISKESDLYAARWIFTTSDICGCMVSADILDFRDLAGLASVMRAWTFLCEGRYKR